MFDIDSGKLLIVAVLALIVIGPKELPRVLRQVGQAVGKMRRMANDFQGQFMDAMKEADIADIRKELNELNSSAKLDYDFNPARDIQAELTRTEADLTRTVDQAFTMPTGTSAGAAAEPAGMGPDLPSPTAGFVLPEPSEPTAVETEIQDATPAQEGIGPLVPELADSAAEAYLTAPPLAAALPKRRIVVKRRHSTFSRMRSSEAAWTSGHPFAIHQRAVRPKLLAPSDAPSA